MNKKYVDYLNGNTKMFEADVDYLESLEVIKEICKTNNVAANDLGSELKNTLEVDQGAFEGYNKTTERYEINLKVAGSYETLEKFLNSCLIKIIKSHRSNSAGFPIVGYGLFIFIPIYFKTTDRLGRFND